MKRRIALMVWSCISPLAWVIMLFITFGYKTDSMTVAITIALFVVLSVIGSLIAAIEFSRGEHFFKTQDELDKEIEEYVRIKKRYQNLIEQYIAEPLPTTT